ncbi:hypothetical protein [Erythrobacter sp. JK5]|uniref:hypothetical protein n=1 Tax=Erythrobacter sp. JK5 TaxID=2829500 RepID=UPI001BA76BCE|nr:hypothetical protein [Erythrobacter sp. JK5]QUL38142.1 hypothetical protein KDC96_01585 [Erythrobacter sp. JK5]
MTSPDIISLSMFCEHARSERGGVASLIGVMPDRINLKAAAPKDKVSDADYKPALPNLAVYTRSRIPLDRELRKGVVIQMLSPSGEEVFSHQFDDEFVANSFDAARSDGKEYLILISQFGLQNFPVIDEGPFTVWVEYGGERFFSGRLHISLSTEDSEG